MRIYLPVNELLSTKSAIAHMLSSAYLGHSPIVVYSRKESALPDSLVLPYHPHVLQISRIAALYRSMGQRNLKNPVNPNEADALQIGALCHLGHASQIECEQHHLSVTLDGSESIRNPGFRSN